MTSTPPRLGGSKNLNGYSKQIFGNLFIRPA